MSKKYTIPEGAVMMADRTFRQAEPVEFMEMMANSNEGHCPAMRRKYKVPLYPAPAFDLLAHLQRQREFSERTFGPGPHAAGLIDHIRKELLEIEADPGDLAEWIDVAILALDGAWRTGASPQQIIDALVAKQVTNEGRTWPDWRTAPADKAIEHDRSGEAGHG